MPSSPGVASWNSNACANVAPATLSVFNQVSLGVSVAVSLGYVLCACMRLSSPAAGLLLHRHPEH